MTSSPPSSFNVAEEAAAMLATAGPAFFALIATRQ
jgi:hypothetical protein